jgi:hypothetical protein
VAGVGGCVLPEHYERGVGVNCVDPDITVFSIDDFEVA